MKGPEAEDFVSDINMTPFVDIVLVLLIVFMISAPLFESKFDVQLPVVKSKDVIKVPPSKFEVCVIRKNGSIEFLDQKFKSIKKLRTFLKKAKLKASVPIFIRADERVTYGLVSRVLGSLKEKGVLNVSLVTRNPNGA